ncbi:hypothetical protein H6G33_15410 [Calothrix sp. FACHB-1219]|uniref:hypothetical protein n=1 Tax=unclassified Calothrix TaxID=2619626 RepID=UPI00168353A8|nr:MULTISPECIES: hypothetical protein [unclassified Calothrix]MBD2207375.1 hypothetical protein [Calothrix sp. FACHB-168]MBD2218423.1 hypothetical protein [Calothrix sp. FACHB-1219]
MTDYNPNLPENYPLIEVIQQEITSSNIKVGSGCTWTGSGAEPQWNNSKSTKAYDHIERHHGPKLTPEQLRGRVASKNKYQGQWLNTDDWVNAEQATPKYPGRYVIDFKRPIGRVYHPDGTITENVTRAFVQRNKDGTLNSAYPVLDSFVL